MDRAVAPVVGVALLIAITVMAAAAVATAALALDTPGEPTRATVSLAVDAEADRLRLTHRGGDTLDVDRLSLSVTVDGDPLSEQPPVPFFAATGYVSGPTGPFNSGADPRWSAGETAGFRLASTNSPTIDSGDVVTVRMMKDGRLVSRVRVRAS